NEAGRAASRSRSAPWGAAVGSRRQPSEANGSGPRHHRRRRGRRRPPRRLGRREGTARAVRRPDPVEDARRSRPRMQPGAAVSRGRYSIHLMGRMDDKLLARCATECHPVSMKGRLALWLEGESKLFGYTLRSPHRRLEWRVSSTAILRGATATRIYYLTPSLSSPQFPDLRSFAWR